jgi:hypothetical protein
MMKTNEKFDHSNFFIIKIEFRIKDPLQLKKVRI